MALHLHLIDPLGGVIPAAAPQTELNVSSVVPQLALKWQLDRYGRPRGRWTRD